MSDLLTDVLALDFMRRALLGGAAVAVMAGLLGTFVVQRRLAFLGDGLAHAAFGGIAAGALASHAWGGSWLQHPLWVALPFTVAVAVVIAWVRDRTQLSSDTAIGVFFALSVALGVVFLSRIPPDANVVDVWHLLFGSILAVGADEVRVLLPAAALVVAALLAVWSRLAYATFDEELARADGVPVRALEYLLFVLAAVAVVVSAEVVGIVLMAAYLVIPAATARLLVRSLAAMTAWSVGLGLASTLAGLLVAFAWDVPAGASVILLQAAAFGVAVSLQPRR